MLCCHGTQSIFLLLATIARPLPRRLSSLHLSSWTTCYSPCMKSITSCSFFLYVSTFSYFFICLGGAHTMIHVWRSEDNLQESVFPDHCVGLRNQIQKIRLCGKHFTFCAILMNPLIFFLHSISYKGAEGLPS